MIRILTIFVAATLATSSLAQGLILVDPENGHYLGNLNSNKYGNCPACLAALVAEFSIQPRRISAIN